jgi:uncharacterized protein (TIGR02145 family)
VEQQMAYSPTPTPSYPSPTTLAGPDYDPTVYGDWYQWGRRKDGHQDRTTPASGTYAGILADFEGLDVSYLNYAGQILNDYYGGIQNQFIQRNNTAVAPDPVSTQDWRQYPGDGNTATSPANDWTWRNPANDPCLEELGAPWRVPTQSEWAQIVSNNTFVYHGGNTKGFLIRPGSSTKNALFLPAAGNRNRSGGTPASVSANGNYWSSTPAGTSSYNLYFAGSGTPNASTTTNRSYGVAVRCVAE